MTANNNNMMKVICAAGGEEWEWGEVPSVEQRGLDALFAEVIGAVGPYLNAPTTLKVVIRDAEGRVVAEREHLIEEEEKEEEDLPLLSYSGGMTVPGECQGQIVEVAYSTGIDRNGRVFRRIFDRSDRSECWAYADLEDEADWEDWEPWNWRPTGYQWHPCRVVLRDDES